ncbi:TetR/AcrR family transcriptional regulator [Novosphingobium album (ex Liu et al. 2023)]|uniref:Helix-turn-helix domain containing protein n=1 Tax=Novosphingobium album (ex Liu et al. 2023) TaxID=3031130 RepID=A0ABT5WWY7_9SPHN|nr:TetR/AcrR family transcriptional regulator [Novosphingobium album (ex Liu et al. 2023)]MDE8654415.1 helix-turn-helix domain containing protein [Novosphingobium album (ex Liu et al. 2023)]
MILKAAYELLDEGGLEGLTIRAVLGRTGLARRAFYERFGSKDDLVLTVFEQTLHGAAREFREMVGPVADPLDGLRIIVSSLVLGQLGFQGTESPGRSRRSAALSREHLRLAESRPHELQQALSPLRGLIAEQVRKGISLGTFRDADADLQARLIYNLVATTVHTELLAEEGGCPNLVHRERLLESIWEFCRRAIIA